MLQEEDVLVRYEEKIFQGCQERGHEIPKSIEGRLKELEVVILRVIDFGYYIGSIRREKNGGMQSV